MHTIDYIMLALLIGMTVWGLIRGIVRQLGDLAGLILGIIGANIWGSNFSRWLQHATEWQTFICDCVAYFCLFLLIYLTARIIASFIKALTKLVRLGWIDSVLGGLFGAFKLLLLTSIIVNLLMTVAPHADWWRNQELTGSVCYEPIKKFAPQVLHIVWK